MVFMQTHFETFRKCLRDLLDVSDIAYSKSIAYIGWTFFSEAFSHCQAEELSRFSQVVVLKISNRLIYVRDIYQMSQDIYQMTS